MPFGTFFTSKCISKPPLRRVRISFRFPPFLGLLRKLAGGLSEERRRYKDHQWPAEAQWYRIPHEYPYPGCQRQSSFPSCKSGLPLPASLRLKISPHSARYRSARYTGGVSLHPPPQFTRRGNFNACRSVTIRQVSLY